MSGNRFILDTNAIIALLRGNEALVKQLNEADYVAISFISAIEFLAFPALTVDDKALFKKLLSKIDIAQQDLSNFHTLEVIAINKAAYGLKIPDMLIAHAAMVNDASLVTNDTDFKKVTGLNTVQFPLN
jgi:tRNA(fMet)-specific endonuclease VapC